MMNCKFLFAQDGQMRKNTNDHLGSNFFVERRREVRNQMPENSVAVFFSNPVRNRSNDVDYEFHQDPNFYYLSGFLEPNSIFLIYKKPILFNNILTDEILFIQDRNEKQEVWTGRTSSINAAKGFTGFKSVFFTSEFLQDSSFFGDSTLTILRLKKPAGLVEDKGETNGLFQLFNHFKTLSTNDGLVVDDFILKKVLSSLREVKTLEEIELIAKSVSITCDGFVAMMRNVKPDMTEFQVQAEGEYVFRKKGAESIGYPSICGSNENSCVLHYTTNRRTFVGNELILLDMGAEYHGYSADVTRTIPVNGRFSKEQRLIYQLVFDAQKAGIDACQVNNRFQEPHENAVKIIAEGLLKLGIIKETNEYKKYFMHSTSHYLGLDVHDPGTFGPLKNGTIITVEPGIYIPENSPCDKKWWNIGVRIEDDILVRPSGPINLSEKAPRSIEEIERLHVNSDLMNK